MISKIASEPNLSDASILKEANAVLASTIEVPPGIKISVEKGWLTLHGTVGWEFQREAAELSMSMVRGVRGITNKIKETSNEIKNRNI